MKNVWIGMDRIFNEIKYILREIGCERLYI